MNDFTAKIWELIVGLVKHAAEALPGKDGKAKKAQVTEWVADAVNMGENLIPVFKWANMPAVDAFEKFVIGLGIEWAWSQLQLPEDQQVAVARNTPALKPVTA